jgi:hypothetical protein
MGTKWMTKTKKIFIERAEGKRGLLWDLCLNRTLILKFNLMQQSWACVLQSSASWDGLVADSCEQVEFPYKEEKLAEWLWAPPKGGCSFELYP